MFIISIIYKVEIEKIENFLEEHKNFLDEYFAKNIFVVSGRKTPRTGGIIIADNISKTEINDIIKQDPFYINDLAEYEIIEFIPTKFNQHYIGK
ncbi:MAG: YciI family protein [Alphaproteobacteria bacterium]